MIPAIPRRAVEGGGPANFTVGQTAYVGGDMGTLTFILGNDGTNTLNASTFFANIASLVVTGATSEELQITGVLAPVDFSGVTNIGSLNIQDCNLGGEVTLPPGMSYFEIGGDSITSKLTFIGNLPVTMIAGGSGVTVSQVDISAVTGISAGDVSWDYSTQTLDAASVAALIHAIVQFNGSPNTVNADFSGSNSSPLKAVTNISYSGGTNYNSGDQFLYNGIQVAIVDGVDENGAIQNITYGSPNAFSDTSGTCVIVPQFGGNGATFTVTALANTDAQQINTAGGNVQTN